MHLAIVSIPVTDQSRAKDFYERIGFKTQIDRTHQNTRWVQLGLPDERTTISLVTWFEDLKPGSLRGLVVGVDDFDAVRARIAAAGIDISAPDAQKWGRFAYFADPDGNKWTIRGT